MDDARVILLVMVGIFIYLGIYFIVNDGHPKRTKRILNLKKVDYDYKHNLISAYYGVLLILYGGCIFLLYHLIVLGIKGIIIWIVCTAIYYFSAGIFTQKYVINNKRFKI